MFARGEGPLFLQPFLAGGVSIALQKSATAIRPLCCGDPIRRLVAKCFCFGGKTQISNTFQGKNFGVGCRGGVEVVAHSLRDTLLQHKDSDMALLKIDFKNAFNLIDRNVFVKASSEMFPGLERWTRWCYSESPLLIYDHSRAFLSACGVQQGDPLGPLYFCCGLQSLIDRIADLGPVYQKWYMDDGGIVGPVDLLLKVWEILKVDGPALGLHLNPAKCEWSWLNSKCTLPCPLDLVELVPTSRIQMLGVPLGSDEFVSQFVEGKLLKTTAHVMSKLMEFDDAQAAMYLLRISYSIVRANHFMRTTPLPQWSQAAVLFDDRVRVTVTHILGSTLPDDSYTQACTSTKIGGLGIRRVVDHAVGAFTASWHESSVTAREVWARPSFCGSDRAPQCTASATVDRATFNGLVARAGRRDTQRLRRLDVDHANAWSSALPSFVDGKDTVMAPRVYLTCVRRLLGLPVLSAPAPCPLCKQTMDVYGDHALCCKKSGDMITRHNRVRNLIAQFADMGLLAPEMEKMGILGPTDRSRRRPGDVSFKSWAPHRGLAIDVAVICPLAASHLDEAEPCEEYAIRHKHARYDASFVGSHYDFTAMVFETSGALNSEGLAVIKQIFRCASKRSGMGHSSFCGRAWARLSACIQTSVAQTILNREGDDICVNVDDDVDVWCSPLSSSTPLIPIITTSTSLTSTTTPPTAITTTTTTTPPITTSTTTSTSTSTPIASTITIFVPCPLRLLPHGPPLRLTIPLLLFPFLLLALGPCLWILPCLLPPLAVRRVACV